MKVCTCSLMNASCPQIALYAEHKPLSVVATCPLSATTRPQSRMTRWKPQTACMALVGWPWSKPRRFRRAEAAMFWQMKMRARHVKYTSVMAL